jgi:hypothetical protein
MRAGVALLCALLVGSAAGAAEPVPLPGAIFAGEAVIKAKVPDAGTLSGPVEITLSFGPTVTPALDAGEFLIVVDDTEETLELTGTYTVDAKGQPVLTLALPNLGDELRALMIHVCEDILLIDPAECAEIADLDADIGAYKLKAKTSQTDGGVISFSGKIPFVLTDGMTESKISLSFKTSPPAPLAP